LLLGGSGAGSGPFSIHETSPAMGKSFVCSLCRAEAEDFEGDEENSVGPRYVFLEESATWIDIQSKLIEKLFRS